jgi:hypothetical protein
MLTGILIFIILGIVFWLLSKFLGKIARGLKEAAKSEAYFKSTLLENVQSINEGVNPTPEKVDLIAEIGRVNRELVEKENQRLEDRKAVESLINSTEDNIT